MHRLAFLLLPALLLLGAACGSNREAVETVDLGTLDGVEYEVPESFAVVPERSEPGLVVMKHARYKNGLFLAALPGGADRDAVIDQIVPRLSAVVLEGQSTSFRWREMESPAASSFETYHERRLGFNGRSLFHLQVRQLNHSGRDLLTGYYWTSEGESGPVPATAFQVYAGGDNVPAGEGSARLIGSIVGEQPPDTYNPPPMAAPPPGN